MELKVSNPNTDCRDKLIDTFRGIMLVLMTLDHSNLFFAKYTFQFLGAFSAAEGFVYLSGFVYGLVYIRYISNPKLLLTKIWQREIVMYKYHLAAFSILFIEHLIFYYLSNKGLHPNFEPFRLDFFMSFFKFALLIKYMYMIFLIPMYMLFFILGLSILYLHHKKLIWVGITISGLFWLYFILSKQPYSFIDSFKNADLSDSFRIFNPLSWFFIFVVGIYWGLRRYEKIPLNHNRFFLLFAFLYCLAFLIMRRIPELYEMSDFAFRTKSLIGPFRLINFFAFIYLLSWLTRNIKLQTNNYFSLLGKYSITIYTFQIIVIYNLIKLGSFVNSLPKWSHIIIGIILIWTLTLPLLYKEYKTFKDISVKNIFKTFLIFPDHIIYFLTLLLFRAKAVIMK